MKNLVSFFAGVTCLCAFSLSTEGETETIVTVPFGLGTNTPAAGPALAALKVIPPSPPVANLVRPLPTFIQSQLSKKDTNVGIGVWYPAGSSDFIYLIAGVRPRGGDPRLPAIKAPLPAPLAIPSSPIVIFEIAPRGSKAVMTRRMSSELIFDFPPGTKFAGPQSPRPASPAVELSSSTRR
jgi:hypothetical protein